MPTRNEFEDRRNAGGGDLRVIGDHRAARDPHHFRARNEVGFEMVGMKFDQARQQIFAFEIDARSPRALASISGMLPPSISVGRGRRDPR